MNVAIFTGVDKYKEPGIDLNGCARDARNMSTFMEMRYDFGLVRLYTDEQVTTSSLPQILTNAMQSLEPGDEFLWYHSGHGTQVYDANGDEEDSVDEALVLHDSDWDSMFTDDLIREIFKDFPADAYCTFLFDTCFSGGMFRFTKTKGVRQIRKYRVKIANAKGRRTKLAHRATSNSVMISACQEGQYSEEAVFADNVEGAFTHNLIQCLNKTSADLSNKSLCLAVSDMLRKGGFQQDPLIAGTEAMQNRGFLGRGNPMVVEETGKTSTNFWKKLMRLIKKLFGKGL